MQLYNGNVDLLTWSDTLSLKSQNVHFIPLKTPIFIFRIFFTKYFPCLKAVLHGVRGHRQCPAGDHTQAQANIIQCWIGRRIKSSWVQPIFYNWFHSTAKYSPTKRDLPNLASATSYVLLANVTVCNLVVCTIVKTILSIYLGYAYLKVGKRLEKNSFKNHVPGQAWSGPPVLSDLHNASLDHSPSASSNTLHFILVSFLHCGWIYIIKTCFWYTHITIYTDFGYQNYTKRQFLL